MRLMRQNIRVKCLTRSCPIILGKLDLFSKQNCAVCVTGTCLIFSRSLQTKQTENFVKKAADITRDRIRRMFIPPNRHCLRNKTELCVIRI